MNVNLHTPLSSGRRCWRPGLAAILFLLLGGGGASLVTAQTRADEFSIKAACIYNFIKFVKWPPDTTTVDQGREFVVGIVGLDPFGDAFAPVENKPVAGEGKVLRIRRFGPYNSDSDYSSCHLLFIASSEMVNVERILRRTAGKPILTVGDSGRFLESGVMINLIMVDQRVRWEINLHQAENSGLQINSQVLRLATRVLDK